MNKRKYCKQLVDYNDLVKKDDCKPYDLLFLRQKEIMNVTIKALREKKN